MLALETKITKRNLAQVEKGIYPEVDKHNIDMDITEDTSQDFHFHRSEKFALPRSNSSVVITAIIFHEHNFLKILT